MPHNESNESQHKKNINDETPEMRRVMRQVSLGRYNLSRDPLATNSTTASDLPARCKNGKNCFAFGMSCNKTKTVYRVISGIKTKCTTHLK